jgi:hypothetical protein
MTQVGAKMLHVNTQLDMMKLTDAFCNFANVPKNCYSLFIQAIHILDFAHFRYNELVQVLTAYHQGRKHFPTVLKSLKKGLYLTANIE